MSSINEEKRPIKISDVTVDHILPDKLEENERSNGQLMAYIRDPDQDQVMIQTCMIPISDFGIPGHHKQFYDTFDKRAHLKLPLDAKQNPNIQKMIDIMIAIDEKFNSVETREKLFGTKDNEEWEYQDIVRESNPAKDGRARPPFMKLKLDTVYDTEFIKTLLIDTEGNVIQAENSASLEDEQLYTIDEFTKYVKFKSKVMLVITPCKVWTMSQKINKKSIRNYGITWKVKQIKVSPPQYAKSTLTRSIFVPDDEDDASMGTFIGGDAIASASKTINTAMAAISMGEVITADTIDDANMASSSPSEDIGDSSDDDIEIEKIEKPIKKRGKSKGKGL